MCECPSIKVLSIGTSLYLNVETEPKTKWCSDGESEPLALALALALVLALVLVLVLALA